jgi:hypothetical protein
MGFVPKKPIEFPNMLTEQGREEENKRKQKFNNEFKAFKKEQGNRYLKKYGPAIANDRMIADFSFWVLAEIQGLT